MDLPTTVTSRKSSVLRSTENIQISPTKTSDQDVLPKENLGVGRILSSGNPSHVSAAICAASSRKRPKIDTRPTVIRDDELSDEFEPNKNKAVQKKKKQSEENFNIDEDFFQIGESRPPANDEHLKQYIQRILPVEYEHVIVEVGKCSQVHDVPHGVNPIANVRATIRINLRSKEEALEWLELFKASSFLHLVINDSYKDNTMKIIYKKGFSCHMNSNPGNRYKSHHKKHIKCPGSLTITVKNYEMKRSDDKYLKSHPTEVKIHYCHNHPMEAKYSLRHRKPKPEVVAKFCKMFSKGHSPSSAWNVHRYDIQLEKGDEFFKYLGDGAECPNLQWCYYQFYKSYEDAYGSFQGDKLYESLQSAVNDYNESMKSICAKMLKQNEEVIVAICSPLMKRVHTLRSSGEIVFVDTGGGVDRDNYRFLLMVTPSICGALPLGVILLNSESEATLSKGLNTLQSIMPDNAFNGRGKQGPALVMTDDAPALRNSIAKLYTCAILLLCKFHVLQAFWDYVWDSQHGVLELEDKRTLFLLFKRVLNMETMEEFEKSYDFALEDETLAKYPKVLKHMKDLRRRSNEWAMCHRAKLITRGNDTDNYVESNIKSFKDIVMGRCKAFSVVQLFDFITTRFQAYYERRIADVLNDRLINYTKSKFYFPPEKLAPIVCERSTIPNQYNILNTEKKTEYVVDMDLEACSCKAARGGAPCKHLCAVVKKYNLSCSQILECNEEMKRVLHLVMTGTLENVPDNWYEVPTDYTKCAMEHELVFNMEENVTDLTADVMSQELEDKDKNNNEQDEKKNSKSEEEEEEEQTKFENEQDEKKKDFKKCQEDLQKMFDLLNSKLESSPDVFVPATQKFCDKFFKTVAQRSENALVSALHSFSSDLAGRNCMLRGPNVKVGKRSVGRRKSRLGGTRVQKSGRPTKRSVIGEHGYSATSSSLARHKLPHNLTIVVDHKTKKKIKCKGALKGTASLNS